MWKLKRGETKRQETGRQDRRKEESSKVESIEHFGPIRKPNGNPEERKHKNVRISTDDDDASSQI